MIRLIPQGKQIHLTERIFPYHETDEKANVMSFFDNFSALFRFIIYSSKNRFK